MMVAHKETLQPLGDAVLVRRFDPTKETEGGLLLPDSAQRVNPRGKVIAVGEGRVLENGTLHKLLVKPGDTVIMAPGSPVGAVQLENGSDQLFIVDYDCIWGIVR